MTTRPPSPQPARRAPARPAWSKSPQLDRAIQELVRRWVGPSLLVMGSACSAVDEPPDDGGAGTPAPAGGGGSGAGGGAAGMAGRSGTGGAAGTGGEAGGGVPVGALEPFAPDLPADGSGFDAMHCADDLWDPMPHVTPADEHDYAALRTGNIDNPGIPPTTILSEVGTRCAGASDADACSAALDVIPVDREPSDCGQAGCNAYWISSSDGDEVRHWASREDLLAFLGELDSPDEALLIARLEGYQLGHGVESDPCLTAAVREVADGYEVFAKKMTESCAPVRMTRYLLHVSRQGVVTVLDEATASESSACIGRRPEGLLPARAARAASELGGHLARNAHLEAAAVVAFDRMLAELQLHGAPARLLRAAERARADEVRHAARVAALSERSGGVVPQLEVQALPPRSLLAIALENAVEGCVRETWGALVGTWQAAHARDPELRALMQELAVDERRHATLSFELAQWLDGRLDETERAEVAAAFERAIAELRAEVCEPPSAALQSLAGLPDAHTARALLDALDAQLLH